MKKTAFAALAHILAQPRARGATKPFPGPFTSGEYLGLVDFADEGEALFNEPYDQGLEGRLVTDLRTLTMQSLITPNDHFFIRTRVPDQIDWSKPWQLSVGGLVNTKQVFSVAALEERVEPMGDILLECSGNGRRPRHFGLLSAAHWSGVPLMELLKQTKPRSRATHILVKGFDNYSRQSRSSVPGASWIFSLHDVERFGSFLAMEMNHQALPMDHGYPVRLITPRWYGCTCIKWVTELRLVDDNAPATSQMTEFARRTHQTGRPKLARDYTTSDMEHAAVAVRVEKWRVNGRFRYRLAGVLWGGTSTRNDLLIRFGKDVAYQPVDHCVAQTRTETWSMWWHEWTPSRTGRYDITLRFADAAAAQRRLDSEYYRRTVAIDDV